jgi:Na+-translocating ferredoxin:NAD+ oxidoreductase RnfC subunit
MANKISDLALHAGVVGAGGAGFPTHVKLDAQVDTVILNGAECEPLMSVDQILMLSFADRLTVMFEEIRQELGAQQAIIGIKAKHKEAVTEMQRATAHISNMRIEPLGDFYPAGDEVVLVYETTGRLIPHSSIPLNIGAVVLNVETLFNIEQAKKGEVLTQKWVTVTGAVAHPSTFKVPLGVSVQELLALAGGATIPDYAVLDGGPMMGRLVEDLTQPVTKTTKGLVVLPLDNPAVSMQLKPLSNILREARAMCCQCRLCTDLCPRHLLGYDINPHKSMMAASFGTAMAGSIPGAYLCSECGVCDQYACPMGLSPRRVNQLLKAELLKLGIKNPYVGKKPVIDPMRQFGRIPTNRLVRRLDLKRYPAFAPFKHTSMEPVRVLLPLKQHIGVASQPIVKTGDTVTKGQLIAEKPEGKLGSRIFASISGRVTNCNNDRIEIQAVKS